MGPSALKGSYLRDMEDPPLGGRGRARKLLEGINLPELSPCEHDFLNETADGWLREMLNNYLRKICFFVWNEGSAREILRRKG